MILAEVAVHTGDRNLLQQLDIDARDGYPTGSSFVRRMATHVLTRAAWQCDDVHDTTRWLGGDITLLGTPLTPEVLALAEHRYSLISSASNPPPVYHNLDAVIHKLGLEGCPWQAFAAPDEERGAIDGRGCTADRPLICV